MDLGILDKHNMKSLSSMTIEPLIVTMEHEIIHMLMYCTALNKLNDLNTVKSGHTRVFKTLVYNIFGHYKVTHSYSIGDVKKCQAIQCDIQLGDFVEDTVKAVKGYVVGKKEKYLIICSINNGISRYTSSMYKDLKTSDIGENKPIDIIGMINRLQPGIQIQYNKLKLVINRVNKITIGAETTDGKMWNIPIFRILDIIFLD